MRMLSEHMIKPKSESANVVKGYHFTGTVIGIAI
jgi:hypothetical protein